MRSRPFWTAALLVVAAAFATPAARADVGGTGTGGTGTTGVLSKVAGLSARSSSAPSGLVASQAQLDTLLRSVSALDLTAHFLGDATSPRQRVGAVELAGGADVTLHAHLSRQAGQAAAALDSLELTTSGVKLGGLAIKSVAVDSHGAMKVQLDSWVPNVSIKQVEHRTNGDVVLHTPWWLPNVTVSPDGTTRTSVLGVGFKVGNVDARLFAHWPPSLDDLEKLLPGGDPNRAPEGTSNALAPTTDALSQLAGTIHWNVSGTLANDTLAVGGKPVDATIDATLSGDGRIQNGTFATIGDANTVSLQVRGGAQSVGDATSRGDLKDLSAKLDGRYRLSVPLDDPGKKLQVEFDGQASYAVSGSNVQLSLPQGAKLSIGDGDVSGTARLSVKSDLTTGLFDASGSTADYVAHVHGPIQVQNLGAVQSLGVDGSTTLTGKATLAGDHLALQGKLSGEHQVAQDGIVQILDGTAVARGLLKAGSKVNLDVSDAQAQIRLGLVSGGKPTLSGASGSGRLSGQVGLGDVSVEVDTGALGLKLGGSASAGIDAPFAASIGADGKLVVDPARTRATIPLQVELKQGSTIDLRDPKNPTRFTLDRDGSSIQVTGKLGFDALGRPVLSELDGADVSLKLGPAPAVIAGQPIGGAAEKTVELKGRVVLRPNGLDVYGSFAVQIQGDAATPILSVDYAPAPAAASVARGPSDEASRDGTVADGSALDPAVAAAIQKRGRGAPTSPADTLLKDALEAEKPGRVAEDR